MNGSLSETCIAVLKNVNQHKDQRAVLWRKTSTFVAEKWGKIAQALCNYTAPAQQIEIKKRERNHRCANSQTSIRSGEKKFDERNVLRVGKENPNITSPPASECIADCSLKKSRMIHTIPQDAIRIRNPVWFHKERNKEMIYTRSGNKYNLYQKWWKGREEMQLSQNI